MNTKRILAVDDEPLNLKIIRATLTDPSYRLDLAVDGESGWQHIVGDPNPYDLIILDRMMPDIDGLTLLKRLKQDDRYRNVPVIMQTAAAAPEQVAEGLMAGAYYYLTKPYEPEALRTIVSSAFISFAQSAALAKAARDCDTVRPLVRNAEFHFSTIAEANALVAQLALLCPIPANAALGISELLINAVEHGNLELSYADKSRLKWADAWEAEIEQRLQLPAYRDRQAVVTFSVEAEELVFSIRDEGPGFDWETYLDFSPERAFDPNGRGIAMAKKMSFSSLEYQGKGNVVIARIRRD